MSWPKCTYLSRICQRLTFRFQNFSDSRLLARSRFRRIWSRKKSLGLVFENKSWFWSRRIHVEFNFFTSMVQPRMLPESVVFLLHPQPTYLLPADHMWQELGLRDKKCFMVDLFWNWPMMMCRLRIQKLKIGLLGDFEKMRFLCFYIIGV